MSPERAEIAARLAEPSPQAKRTEVPKPKPKSEARPKQGRALELTDPEPWSEPVSGEGLADEIRATFQRFLVLPDGASEALALWVLHTHAHGAADISPILALASPDKRCGKTSTLTVLRWLVRRPLMSAHTTTAALFRAIEKWRPTLLVDEADSFLKDNEDLRGILNSGHTVTGVVLRTVGEDFEPRTFSTWAPKAIALIGKLPGTLEDRAIVLRLRRRSPDEHVERLRLDRRDEFKPLVQRASRWAKDNEASLREMDPEVPLELNDRAQDNWRPLLAIAERIGGHWPELGRRAASGLSGASSEADTAPGIQLLGDLRDLFLLRGTDRLNTTVILRALELLEDRPWAEWRFGKPLSAVQMARLLKPFNVEPRTLRLETGTLRGYYREDFEDAFTRYLPVEVQQAQQADEGAAESAFPTRNCAEGVAPHESALKGHKRSPVAGVSGWEAVEGTANDAEVYES